MKQLIIDEMYSTKLTRLSGKSARQVRQRVMSCAAPRHARVFALTRPTLLEAGDDDGAFQILILPRVTRLINSIPGVQTLQMAIVP